MYNIYIYNREKNIGDLAGYYILEKNFPQFKANPSSKKYIFFGGSTFFCHHYVDAEEIIYFGNGLASFPEMVLPKYPITIYPRGEITKNMLERSGVKCQQVVGDIVQFLALEEPVVHNDALDELYIKDAYSNVDFIPMDSNVIGVSETPLTRGLEIISSIPDFKKRIEMYGKVVSSQIHPFLIAIMLGKPAKLIPKDVRALDICNYYDIPFDCTIEDAMRARERAIASIPMMKELFLQIIQAGS